MNFPVDYDTHPWPRIRNILELFLTGARRHTLFGTAEYDITKAIEKIAQNEDGPSLNTFLVYSIAQTAIKNEKMRTFKYKQKKIVFKHADIGMPILKTLPSGLKIPVWYIVRKADTKTLEELNQELREAVIGDLANDKNVKFRRKLSEMPIFIQRFVYAWIFRHPVRIKKYFGNMGITNVRQQGFHSPFVGLAMNIYSCQISVGNVSDKFLPDENKNPSLRSVIQLGAGFDHIVMDGMCITTIAKELGQQLESAKGFA